MKILSLFDGMACGYLAMLAAGVHVDSYHAYEIDKYAIQTAQHNFPDIVECGDVFNADFTIYKAMDFLVGGSPCTYWSIARQGRETTASGMGWELFNQYVRALKDDNPKYFIYENNSSMSKAIRQAITETFGFEPIEINSSLVSAQNRKRLYWVGRQNGDSYEKVSVEMPKERGIVMNDILDDAITDKQKGYAVTHLSGNARDYFKKHHTNICFVYPQRNGTQTKSKQYRVYNTSAKGVTICGQGGGMGAKTGLYAIKGKQFQVKGGKIKFGDIEYDIDLKDGSYEIRSLSVAECKRMQTVPEWYAFPVSDTQAYKMLGNGWTIEVIAHLIRATLENEGKFDEHGQMMF